MEITKIVQQNRRDFTAIYECESCGSAVQRGGYDDRNFHDNVIPYMECENCGKSRRDLGIEKTPTKTKYPEGFQI